MCEAGVQILDRDGDQITSGRFYIGHDQEDMRNIPLSLSGIRDGVFVAPRAILLRGVLVFWLLGF